MRRILEDEYLCHGYVKMSLFVSCDILVSPKCCKTITIDNYQDYWKSSDEFLNDLKVFRLMDKPDADVAKIAKQAKNTRTQEAQFLCSNIAHTDT